MSASFSDCDGSSLGDLPAFVEVGEAGIAVDHAMRRQRRVQLVGWCTWIDELQVRLRTTHAARVGAGKVGAGDQRVGDQRAALVGP